MPDQKQARCNTCGRRDVPVYEVDGSYYLENHHSPATDIERYCNGSHGSVVGRVVTVWVEVVANAQ